MNVQQVITAVKRDLGAVSKGRRMEAGPAKYSYRSIDDVLNKLHDGMVEHGCIFAPALRSIEQSDAGETKFGTKQSRTLAVFDWHVYGPEGDSITAATAGEAIDSGDKGTNKAATAAFKMLLTQLLAIPFETDDPDDHHTEQAAPSPVERTEAKRAAPTAKPTQTSERKCGTCTYTIGANDPVKMRAGKPHHKACLEGGKPADNKINTPEATKAALEKAFPGATEYTDPDERPF